jgi:hypothetical protein
MSTGTVAPCPLKPDPCKELLDKIMEYISRDKRPLGNNGTHGLKHRFPEQINGRNGPGTASWTNHENEIKNQQKNLEKKLKEYEKKGCGDPPPGAWDWATRPVPKPEEWKGPLTLPPEDAPLISRENLETGAKVGLVGIGLYATYRIIRMIPSVVFPPLWPTIPANAAIP